MKDIGNDIKKLYKGAKTIITNPGEFAKALLDETKKTAKAVLDETKKTVKGLWKDIKPPLKLAWEVAISPIKFSLAVTFGATDMISNYLTYKKVNEEMRNAKQDNKDLDKYFHCVANCQAARRGLGGKIAAVVISEGREISDEYLKGDTREVCDEDRAANKTGREGDKNLSCRVVCKSYRPPELDPKY